MTISEVKGRFEGYNPRNEKEILQYCRVPLKYMDSGEFRNVYEIPKMDVVVKIPIDKRGLSHSRREIRALERIVNKDITLKPMKRFLPKVYYADPKTGVILMRKYRGLKYTPKNNGLTTLIGLEIAELMGLEDDGWDYHIGNFGKDAHGRIVLLDLGCLEGYPCD